MHGGVSSLAEQLPGTLAPELEVRDAGRIEEHHGLGIHAAILDDAKRQHVHARFPGELGRGDLLRHQRIGEARAVHMHAHVALVSNLGQRGDFRRRVDRAALGGLGERQHARLHAMHMRFEPGEPRGEIVRRDLGARAADQRQLRAAGEELRRAAFVALDMRLGVCQHGSPRGTEGGERQRIGSGAGRHREHAHLVPKNSPNTAIEPFRPAIRAIGDRRAVVGVGEGLKDFTADRGRVVGLEKAHGLRFY